MSAAMSQEDAREAMEARAYARAYETALREVIESDEFIITPRMLQDIQKIVTQNPNPLIKVDLLHKRLKETALGKRVEFNAILKNDHGLAERMRNSEKEAQAQLEAKVAKAAAEVAKAAAAAAAAAAAIEDEQITNARIRQGISYGKYITLPPAAAAAPLANPLTIEFRKPSKKHGGKKSYKKSHKKGGKKSHKKSHRRRH